MTGEANEARKQPGVAREYANDAIVVYWRPALCIHAARCLAELPAVFDVAARPWVSVNNAPPGEVERAVRACPTGALSYERRDGRPDEPSDTVTTVQPRTNGPLFLRGEIEIMDAAGATVLKTTRVALCRCGGSQNKPYCDLTHRMIGFRSE